ncbi:MAG: hypothetical protein H6964_16870 [Chromatiaceae bacterium]|nr:hypothetical protein [Gammaproteobacteria bacterium]MCB1878607.1 hypothetical protein [Gammaproteobacteria bacterium]MCP5448651.1 hypothetical protein [Chromatiaceae bacterium]
MDAARNSTDDFNPFHDPYKWQRIKDNPFSGPIALGFQLEALAAHQIELHRNFTGEVELIAEHQLNFANYQVSFADVVNPGDEVEVDIRPTKKRLDSTPQLSNRLTIRKGRQPVLIGYQRESQTPLVLEHVDFSSLVGLERAADRSFIEEGTFFLKRKFMNNSNAKNFLIGSLVEQHYYFDELEDRVRYPGMFPVALVSCALLEKAHLENYDFYLNPMVYTSHEVSIERSLLSHLKSNDRLHLLVQGPDKLIGEKGLGKSSIPQVCYQCFGLVNSNDVLFRARVNMALLKDVVGAVGSRSNT